MSQSISRRRTLKLIGFSAIGTVSGLLFNYSLDRKPIQNPIQNTLEPKISTLALEKLLLETGKNHLPQELYETTLHHFDS